MNCHAADAAPAALDDLIAAGLVSHEVIGDPGRLGAEAETLRTLCGLVAGPVWRIDAFHYAFRAQPADLGGRLADAAPEDWTAALEAALQAALGADAIWVSPVDILAGGDADLDAAAAPPARPGRGGRRARCEAGAAAGLQAIINARYAAEVARLTAAAGAGQRRSTRGWRRSRRGRQRHRSALGSRRRRPGRCRRWPGSRPAVDRDAERGARGGAAPARRPGGAAARRRQAERIGRIARWPAGPPRPIRGRRPSARALGLTLAEFLARLETQAAPAGPRRLS